MRGRRKDQMCIRDRADWMDYAQEMVGKAQKRGVRLLLPVDTVCGDAFSPDAQRQVVPAGQIPDGWQGCLLYTSRCV